MKKIKDFTTKVHEVVSQVPKGEVLSYQEVAIRAGSPRACRAVGNIMHHNPDPKNIPCHRVVASGLKLGGYAWGSKVKTKKLQAEGWQIKNGQLSR